nr:hypothetical protein [Tanacetum cinerariifolium]
MLVFSILDFINTTNSHQSTMSNRKERIGNSRANGNCSKIINSVKQIHAIVDGKAVVISESSVRSDILFDDEDAKKVLRAATSACHYISRNYNLSKYLLASPAISPFHNMQAYNAANKPPIPPQDPITPPTILTPYPVLPPSLLFDPRHFFVPEELLPPKKQIHPLSSSSTTLSNSSRKQACILVPPSFSTYTPTLPQIYELGKSSIKMCAKHHEKQVESILSYLEELSFHYIEKMEERLVNGWIIIPRDFDEVKTKLKEACTLIRELQKKRMGQRDKISFIRFRISDLEMTFEDI